MEIDLVNIFNRIDELTNGDLKEIVLTVLNAINNNKLDEYIVEDIDI